MKRKIIAGKEFCTYVKTPLIADDVHAYNVIWNTGFTDKNAGMVITAKRSDGVTVTDYSVTDKQGRGEYTLAGNMYSVTGPLEIRLSLVWETTTLTEKVLIFEVIEGSGNDKIESEDNVPILNTILAKATEAVEKTSNMPTKLSQFENDKNFVQDENYIHTDNNYTSKEKEKLENIPQNAQVNVIEKIKVNGEELLLEEKTVEVIVPTKLTELNNDGNFVQDEEYVHTDNNFTDEYKETVSQTATGVEEINNNMGKYDWIYDYAFSGIQTCLYFNDYIDLVKWFNEHRYPPDLVGDEFNGELIDGQHVAILDDKLPNLIAMYDPRETAKCSLSTNEEIFNELKNKGYLKLSVYKFRLLGAKTGQINDVINDKLEDYSTTEQMNEAITASRPNDYELIKTIEITEDIPTVDEEGNTIPISFDLDDNGKTFKLDALRMWISSEEAIASDKYWRCDVNKSGNTMFYKKPGGGQYFHLHTERLKEKSWWTENSIKFNDKFTGSALENGYMMGDVDYITSLYLKIPNAPIGTTVAIYGRRVGE